MRKGGEGGDGCKSRECFYGRGFRQEFELIYSTVLVSDAFKSSRKPIGMVQRFW